ncbi:hypothetical protein B0H14DRAFT_2305339, partial [Mycena olivaceomarginata]
RVALVTGGNTEWFQIVKQQLRKNAKVHPPRSRTKLTPIFIHPDLGDLQSMGSIAGSFLAQEFTFDLLFNNGCVSFTTRHDVVRGLGANNYHAEFGTNVLGPFFLAEILV